VTQLVVDNRKEISEVIFTPPYSQVIRLQISKVNSPIIYIYFKSNCMGESRVECLRTYHLQNKYDSNIPCQDAILIMIRQLGA
jgi:hypothetical protein